VRRNGVHLAGLEPGEKEKKGLGSLTPLVLVNDSVREHGEKKKKKKKKKKSARLAGIRASASDLLLEEKERGAASTNVLHSVYIE